MIQHKPARIDKPTRPAVRSSQSGCDSRAATIDLEKTVATRSRFSNVTAGAPAAGCRCDPPETQSREVAGGQKRFGQMAQPSWVQ
jgi:hypothetical protein